MQIKRKGMIIYIPKGFWTSNFTKRSSCYGKSDNKRTTKTKPRVD